MTFQKPIEDLLPRFAGDASVVFLDIHSLTPRTCIQDRSYTYAIVVFQTFIHLHHVHAYKIAVTRFLGHDSALARTRAHH